MTRDEVKDLIQGMKDKVIELQKDNPTFESLVKTETKINIQKDEDEKNPTK
jgi:hypothetical protein